MEKSPRNKTIDLSVSMGQQYLSRCRTVTDPVYDIRNILDVTVLGDMHDVCPLLPQKSVDLVFADPPYNMDRQFGDSRFHRMSIPEYTAYTKDWISIIYSLMKPGASIYVCCDWRTGMLIGNILDEFFMIRNRITWRRGKGRGAKSNWKDDMEDIWFATKGGGYKFHADAVKVRKKVIAPYRTDGQPKDWEETGEGKFRDTCASNFWDDLTVPFWSMPENTAHPTQKPEKLLAKVILASTDPGDIILDPFLGSGTTSVVAKKLGRHYIGIEQEEQYCIWAEKRLEMAGVDKRIQGYADGVFRERNQNG